MKYIALARKDHPEWVSRPRGRLWFEGELPIALMQATCHAGDPDAFQAYVENNREELWARAAETRERAAKALDAVASAHMPYSNREWLDWLSKNKDYFMGVLRDATKNRRSIGQRLVPAAELPPCERIQPKASDAASKPTWVKKLVQCGSG